jgi:hypothetical protein
VTLAYSLPTDSPVTIELFDLAGARVLAHDLGRQHAGAHSWSWPETSALAPGLYLAKLTTGAAHREAKVVLLR